MANNNQADSYAQRAERGHRIGNRRGNRGRGGYGHTGEHIGSFTSPSAYEWRLMETFYKGFHGSLASEDNGVQGSQYCNDGSGHNYGNNSRQRTQPGSYPHNERRSYDRSQGYRNDFRQGAHTGLNQGGSQKGDGAQGHGQEVHPDSYQADSQKGNRAQGHGQWAQPGPNQGDSQKGDMAQRDSQKGDMAQGHGQWAEPDSYQGDSHKGSFGSQGHGQGAQPGFYQRDSQKDSDRGQGNGNSSRQGAQTDFCQNVSQKGIDMSHGQGAQPGSCKGNSQKGNDMCQGNGNDSRQRTQPYFYQKDSQNGSVRGKSHGNDSRQWNKLGSNQGIWRRGGDSSGGHYQDNRSQSYQGQNDSSQEGRYSRQASSGSGFRGDNFDQQQRKRNRVDDKDDMFLSKTLSFILRHGAEKLKFKLMPGGFLYVDEILKKMQKLEGFTEEDVKRIVAQNDKQRFALQKDEGSGRLKIRANQGHTVEVEDLKLTVIESDDQAPVVLHGTYYDAWNSIKTQGLCRFKRNHIHFAAGEPGENGVISGMRSSCQVLIYIDLEKALKDGLKFYLSANSVILSPGNEKGYIYPCYFKAVLNRYSFDIIPFDPNIKGKTMSADQITDELDKKDKKKKSKKNKEDRENNESGAPGEEIKGVGDKNLFVVVGEKLKEEKEDGKEKEKGKEKEEGKDEEDQFEDAMKTHPEKLIQSSVPDQWDKVDMVEHHQQVSTNSKGAEQSKGTQEVAKSEDPKGTKESKTKEKDSWSEASKGASKSKASSRTEAPKGATKSEGLQRSVMPEGEQKATKKGASEPEAEDEGAATAVTEDAEDVKIEEVDIIPFYPNIKGKTVSADRIADELDKKDKKKKKKKSKKNKEDRENNDSGAPGEEIEGVGDKNLFVVVGEKLKEENEDGKEKEKGKEKEEGKDEEDQFEDAMKTHPEKLIQSSVPDQWDKVDMVEHHQQVSTNSKGVEQSKGTQEVAKSEDPKGTKESKTKEKDSWSEASKRASKSKASSRTEAPKGATKSEGLQRSVMPEGEQKATKKGASEREIEDEGAATEVTEDAEDVKIEEVDIIPFYPSIKGKTVSADRIADELDKKDKKKKKKKSKKNKEDRENNDSGAPGEEIEGVGDKNLFVVVGEKLKEEKEDGKEKEKGKEKVEGKDEEDQFEDAMKTHPEKLIQSSVPDQWDKVDMVEHHQQVSTNSKGAEQSKGTQEVAKSEDPKGTKESKTKEKDSWSEASKRASKSKASSRTEAPKGATKSEGLQRSVMPEGEQKATKKGASEREIEDEGAATEVTEDAEDVKIEEVDIIPFYPNIKGKTVSADRIADELDKKDKKKKKEKSKKNKEDRENNESGAPGEEIEGVGDKNLFVVVGEKLKEEKEDGKEKEKGKEKEGKDEEDQFEDAMKTHPEKLIQSSVPDQWDKVDMVEHHQQVSTNSKGAEQSKGTQEVAKSEDPKGTKESKTKEKDSWSEASKRASKSKASSRTEAPKGATKSEALQRSVMPEGEQKATKKGASEREIEDEGAATEVTEDAEDVKIEEVDIIPFYPNIKGKTVSADRIADELDKKDKKKKKEKSKKNKEDRENNESGAPGEEIEGVGDKNLFVVVGEKLKEEKEDGKEKEKGKEKEEGKDEEDQFEDAMKTHPEKLIQSSVPDQWDKVDMVEHHQQVSTNSKGAEQSKGTQEVAKSEDPKGTKESKTKEKDSWSEASKRASKSKASSRTEAPKGATKSEGLQRSVMPEGEQKATKKGASEREIEDEGAATEVTEDAEDVKIEEVDIIPFYPSIKGKTVSADRIADELDKKDKKKKKKKSKKNKEDRENNESGAPGEEIEGVGDKNLFVVVGEKLKEEKEDGKEKEKGKEKEEGKDEEDQFEDAMKTHPEKLIQSSVPDQWDKVDMVEHHQQVSTNSKGAEQSKGTQEVAKSEDPKGTKESKTKEKDSWSEASKRASKSKASSRTEAPKGATKSEGLQRSVMPEGEQKATKKGASEPEAEDEGAATEVTEDAEDVKIEEVDIIPFDPNIKGKTVSADQIADELDKKDKKKKKKKSKKNKEDRENDESGVPGEEIEDAGDTNLFAVVGEKLKEEKEDGKENEKGKEKEEGKDEEDHFEDAMKTHPEKLILSNVPDQWDEIYMVEHQQVSTNSKGAEQSMGSQGVVKSEVPNSTLESKTKERGSVSETSKGPFLHRCGFLCVDENLKKMQKLEGFAEEDIQRVVAQNDKHTFALQKEERTGHLKSRANQGHTMEGHGENMTEYNLGEPGVMRDSSEELLLELAVGSADAEDETKLYNQDPGGERINNPSETPAPTFRDRIEELSGPSPLQPVSQEHALGYNQHHLDSNNFFLGAPSSVLKSHAATVLQRVRCRALCQTDGRNVEFVIPDGAACVIKRERCVLPDGSIYELTSTLIPDPEFKEKKEQPSQTEESITKTMEIGIQCDTIKFTF